MRTIRDLEKQIRRILPKAAIVLAPDGEVSISTGLEAVGGNLFEIEEPEGKAASGPKFPRYKKER